MLEERRITSPQANSYLIWYWVVHVTIGKPAFCIALYLTGIHFRDKLQHIGHMDEQKIFVTSCIATAFIMAIITAI